MLLVLPELPLRLTEPFSSPLICPSGWPASTINRFASTPLKFTSAVNGLCRACVAICASPRICPPAIPVWKSESFRVPRSKLQFVRMSWKKNLSCSEILAHEA